MALFLLRLVNFSHYFIGLVTLYQFYITFNLYDFMYIIYINNLFNVSLYINRMRVSAYASVLCPVSPVPCPFPGFSIVRVLYIFFLRVY